MLTSVCKISQTDTDVNCFRWGNTALCWALAMLYLHIGYRYIANADAAQLDGGGGSPIFEGGVSPISKLEVSDLRPGCN